MLDDLTTAAYAATPTIKVITQDRGARRLEWARADPIDRLGEAYEVIRSRGGKVFTLRLDRDVLIAVTGARDSVRVISRRIQRAFDRAGLPKPCLAFSVEVTPDDRKELHLHGAIVIGLLDPAVVKALLRSAVGRILGRAAPRQVQLKNFDVEKGGPAGWAKYAQKGAARTRRVICQDRLTYMSDDLRRVARAGWEQRRKQKPAAC